MQNTSMCDKNTSCKHEEHQCSSNVGGVFLSLNLHGEQQVGRKFDGRPFFMLHPQMPCPMNYEAVVSPGAERAGGRGTEGG